MLYIHNEILLRHKSERNPGIFFEIDETRKYYAKKNKLNTMTNPVYCPLNVNAKKIDWI